MISSVTTSSTVQQSPIIAEYFGIFDTDWDKRFRADTPFDKLNRVYIAFGKIIQDSTQHFTVAIDGSDARVRQVVARIKQVNPNADIFLSVGGDGGSLSYGGASSDSVFPQNVVQLLKKYDLNGFDIDWENDLDKIQLNNLTTGLAAALHQNSFKLTLDGWPNPFPQYDMAVLSQNLDQINIMSYGASLSLTECAQAYVAQGFPMNKLIGGIETEFDYGGGVDTLGAGGSIAVKAQYALTSNMAGMMAWRGDNDYVEPSKPNFPTYQGWLQLWSSMTGDFAYEIAQPAKRTCVIL